MRRPKIPTVQRLKSALSLVFFNVRTLKPEYVFLVVGSIFGLGFVFLTPPLAAFDETEHFFRSYQVTDFNLFSDKTSAPNVTGVYSGDGYGGKLPSSVVDVASNLRWSIQTAPDSNKSFHAKALLDSLVTPLARGVKKEVRFDNTSIYSPAAYIPQAAGIFIGKLLNLGPVYLIYLGRIANLIVWTALVFLAIKFSPIGKWVFVVFALNPASIFLAGTLSPDTVASGVVALLVAMVFYTRNKKQVFSWQQYLIIAILTILMVLIKNIYLPIVLLLFAVPSKYMLMRWKLLISAVAIMLCLGWNLAILPMTAGIPNYFNIPDHVNSADQIQFIIHNLLSFTKILAWNLVGSPSVLVSYQYVYAIADNTVPFWAILLWTTALIVSFMMPQKVNERNFVNRNTKLLLTTTIVLVCAAIIASLYIGWSPVGSKFMSGIQGRYFFPVSFLIIPLLAGGGFYLSGDLRKAKLFIVFGLTIAILATLAVITLRYWHGITT